MHNSIKDKNITYTQYRKPMLNTIHVTTCVTKSNVIYRLGRNFAARMPPGSWVKIVPTK